MCLLAATVVVASAMPAGPDEGDGYFFLSARVNGKQRQTTYAEFDHKSRVSFSPENYSTIIHGPFKSHYEARRALRALRKREPETTYYTRIYRL